VQRSWLVPITRDDALALDASDPLASLRDRFLLPRDTLYLDGNSLGPRPVGVAERVAAVIADEWGTDLIRSWNLHGWMDAPTRIGDRIGTLIGAAPGQVVAGDSTSVNLYKQLVAALWLRPDRRTIVTEGVNFPTDRYMIDAVAAQFGATVRLADPSDVAASLDDSVAVVCLTQVNYRDGRMHDLGSVTAAAQACGALMLWDLAHSAGALAVDLDGVGADLAVGCSYKYLNGGPGAPAFLYVAERHQRAYRQPLPGWLGHATPFAMQDGYVPADGISRAIVGTPNLLSLLALDAALDAFDGVDVDAVRTKSVALTELFVALVAERCGDVGFTLASPANPAERGSQVCLDHEQGFGIVQALIARGVIGDYREPRICRFGFAPLYIGFADVWDSVDHLVQVMANSEWALPQHQIRAAVT
jgi:kynureninase